MLELPKRTKKTRTTGITAVTDIRLSIGQLSNILDDYAEFVDIAKLGVGVGYVLPKLKEKVALYKKHNVEVYLGGTLFEKFYHQKKLDEYLVFLQENNISTIEISEGTVDIPVEERIKIINEIKDDFTVISEVGSKDPDMIMPPSVWIKEIEEMINAGSKYVITEGRDSGSAGIYRPSGEIRTGLVSDIIKNVDASKLIFEAPLPKLQMYFINLVGANVNLGNINPIDLLLLEAQRVGLRSETFYLEK